MIGSLNTKFNTANEGLISSKTKNFRVLFYSVIKLQGPYFKMSYDIQKSHWISVRGKVRRNKNKKAVKEAPVCVRTMAPSLQLGFSWDLFLDFTGSAHDCCYAFV